MDAPYRNQAVRQNNPQHHLEEGGDHGQPQPPDPAEITLDDLAEICGKIEKRHRFGVFHPGCDDIAVVRKKPDAVRRREPQQRPEQREQGKLAADPGIIKAAHPFAVPVAEVQRDAHHHRGADALRKTEQELLDPHAHVIPGDGCAPQRGKHPLHKKTPDHDDRLLQRGGPCIAQQENAEASVKMQVGEAEVQRRAALFGINRKAGR